jgi:Nodulation protein S (NodS)
VRRGVATRRIGPALKRQWTRIPLHGVHFSDRHDRLELLYRVPDPWQMESEKQSFRFHETNRLIEEHFGRVATLLEVGSGEGHQSAHLLRVCDRLFGIDVSRRAVVRARRRCPDAVFAAADVGDVEQVLPTMRFDLVVACEVLYYMSDVAGTLKRLSELGRACLVSYYDDPADRLDPHVLGIPGVESELIRHGESTWRVAWWRNEVDG